MFIRINPRLLSIATNFNNSPLKTISELSLRNGYITAIALVVIGALAALFFAYFHHQSSNQPHKSSVKPIKQKIRPTEKSNTKTPPITLERQNPLKTSEIKLQRNRLSPQLVEKFKTIEDQCALIAENAYNTNNHISAVEIMNQIDPEMERNILEALEDIVTQFENKNNIPHHLKKKLHQYVPPYFATQTTLSNEQEINRKYLSLVGIRNLFKAGPTIIDDFQKKLYLGGEHHYLDRSSDYSRYHPMEGLKLFKYYTGTVVDLDTELDCKNDVEAIAEARKIIIKFGKDCGVAHSTAEEVARALPNRKLNLPRSGDPIRNVNSDNADRSNSGIWKRQPPGSSKTHYYVNVPNLDIVILATLRLPYMMAELALLTREYQGGKLMNEFYETLFKEGLSDKCFNDKAKQFIEFYHNWKAKLEDTLTPEEIATEKLQKGEFGVFLKQRKAEDVIKEGYNLATFSNLIANDERFDSKNGLNSVDEWISKYQPTIINMLKEKNIWERALFHREDGKDYFLINESMLNLFLKEYYLGLI